MHPVKESVRDKNPYKRGADDGVIMGGLLVLMFVALAFAARSALASWTALMIAVAGVPAMTFVLLRRSYLKDNGLTLFSSLWMQGIVMFFCATLILALFEYVYLRILNPTFMETTLSRGAAFYRATGTAKGLELAGMLDAMVQRNLIPSAISIAVETIWVGVFSGSLLSAVVAATVRMKIWNKG